MKKGDIVQGRITAIKPYGAFVKIDDQTDGLIHISEISDHYVKDIEDYLSVGKVYDLKVLSEKNGDKLSLSFKRLHKRKKRLDIRLKSGFEPLKKALPTWIEAYEKRDHKGEKTKNQ